MSRLSSHFRKTHFLLNICSLPLCVFINYISLLSLAFSELTPGTYCYALIFFPRNLPHFHMGLFLPLVARALCCVCCCYQSWEIKVSELLSDIVPESCYSKNRLSLIFSTYDQSMMMAQEPGSGLGYTTIFSSSYFHYLVFKSFSCFLCR